MDSNTKDIKDYLHFYLGCKCHLLDYEEGKPKTFTLTVYNLNYYRDWIGDIRPILRPLSDMAEEECNKYNEIKGTLFHMADLQNMVMQEAAAIKYLYSIYIDVHGLIDAGIALDKSKIK